MCLNLKIFYKYFSIAYKNNNKNFRKAGRKIKEKAKTKNTGCSIPEKLIPIKAERSRVVFPRMFFVFCHKSLISTNSSIFMLKHEK